MYLKSESEIKHIIEISLSKIGIQLSDKTLSEDLRFLGLDSLATILLLSEIEKNIPFKLSLNKFNEESFYTLDGIYQFVKSSQEDV